MSLSDILPVLLSFWEMARFWKVLSDPIIEPPIHDEYLLCQSKFMCSYSPYLLSYLCILSSKPFIMEEPPQKMAFFMTS